jgi:hypothetical protein
VQILDGVLWEEMVSKLANSLNLLVPRDGLEPPTKWLTACFEGTTPENKKEEDE